MARSSGFETGELTDTAVYILLSLTTPRHGYAIMQLLQDETNGDITIGPASLYTTLKKLTTAGAITEVDDRGNRRSYQLTQTGRELLERNIERRRKLLNLAEQLMEKA